MKAKVGYVSSVYPERCTARVTFPDSDDNVSEELQIIVKGSEGTEDYWMPSVDEQVYCSFTDEGNGFIHGTVYSVANPPPATDQRIRKVKFMDGTEIEYNSNTHTMNIKVSGPIHITAAGNVIVTGDVIADGISLKNHTHNGKDGMTSPPIGG